MLTYSVGYAGSTVGALAMAQYLGAPTLDQAMNAAARYYAGEIAHPLSRLEELAEAVLFGEVGFGEASAELVKAELAKLPRYCDVAEMDAVEERVPLELNAAIVRADFKQAREESPTNGLLRPDLAPTLAKRLGIDPSLPLTETGIANLLNARTLTGGEIEGKRINQPMRDLVEIYGLDPQKPPTGQALENVLAGRRADGSAVLDREGKELTAEALSGPRKRFLTALGAKAGREPTDAEMANILAGKSAQGFEINAHEYKRQIHATKAPLGFVDLTFSMDKSGSGIDPVSWTP